MGNEDGKPVVSTFDPAYFRPASDNVETLRSLSRRGTELMENSPRNKHRFILGEGASSGRLMEVLQAEREADSLKGVSPVVVIKSIGRHWTGMKYHAPSPPLITSLPRVEILLEDAPSPAGRHWTNMKFHVSASPTVEPSS